MLTRFFATARLGDTRYLNDFKTIADEIIRHLSTPDTDLTITVDIQATRAKGFTARRGEPSRERGHPAAGAVELRAGVGR